MISSTCHHTKLPHGHIWMFRLKNLSLYSVIFDDTEKYLTILEWRLNRQQLGVMFNNSFKLTKNEASILLGVDDCESFRWTFIYARLRASYDAKVPSPLLMLNWQSVHLCYDANLKRMMITVDMSSRLLAVYSPLTMNENSVWLWLKLNIGCALSLSLSLPLPLSPSPSPISLSFSRYIYMYINI